MRLFIGINFSADTHSQLIALRDEIRSRTKGGNFTLSENIHLTLVFLGDCTAEQTGTIKAAMDATRFEPFSLRIDCVGRFKRNDGDLWWAGICESKPLIKLQRDLSDRLIANNFALEKRKYRPHITLGRKVISDAAPWTVEPFGDVISTIELIKSERIGCKLGYTQIYERNGRE
jgi:2'-5' RNA ligase